MAFVKNRQLQVGDRVRTTKVFSSCAGKFETGSVVTIIEIGDRGYSIEDDEGNQMIECGWTGFTLIS